MGQCGASLKRGQTGPRGMRPKAWPVGVLDPAEGIQNSKKARGMVENRFKKLKSK